jgi:hypothetical protein
MTSANDKYELQQRINALIAASGLAACSVSAPITGDGTPSSPLGLALTLGPGLSGSGSPTFPLLIDLASIINAVLAVVGTFVDREAPAVAVGPPTTLTVANMPLNDDCCTVWRGAGDGFAMTTGWIRAGKVFTLTSPRVDANESFLISYRR